MLLRQIFIENGHPIPMCIHSSIANPNARAVLAGRIIVRRFRFILSMPFLLTTFQHSGGNPHATQAAARVILADPNTEVFQGLVKAYQGDPSKYIESYLWVKKCIDRGAVAFTPLVYKNPGGRRPGEEYVFLTTSQSPKPPHSLLPKANSVLRRR